MSNPQNKELRITAVCPCGNSFETRQKRIDSGRGKFCSQKCKYKFRVRSSGLNYKIVKENPTSFKKGLLPWNKGTVGLMPLPHNYKGSEVGYDALHDWVKRHRGKAAVCEKCNSTKTVQWANKSHEYKRDLSDWLELCRKCHIKYDRESNQWGTATNKFKIKSRRCKKQQSA